MGRTVTDETRDNIILLMKSGFPLSKIASIVGSGYSTTQCTMQAYKAATSDPPDIAQLRIMVGSGHGAPVRWVCEKYGISLDEVPSPPENPPKVETASERTDAGLSDVEEAVHVAAAKMTDKLESKLDELVKKLEQVSTIIQSCSAGNIKAIDQVRREVNGNADILLGEIKGQTQTLEMIKKNTRPVIDNRLK